MLMTAWSRGYTHHVIVGSCDSSILAGGGRLADCMASQSVRDKTTWQVIDYRSLIREETRTWELTTGH